MSILNLVANNSARELFVKSVAVTLKNGTPGIDAEGSCQYRCGTKRCAIGQLMSDAELDAIYANGINHKPVSSMLSELSLIMNNSPLSCSAAVIEKIDILSAVQRAHDNAAIRAYTNDEFVESFRMKTQTAWNLMWGGDLDAEIARVA